MRIKTPILTSLAVLSMTASSAAMAGTTSSTLNVNATVSASCNTMAPMNTVGLMFNPLTTYAAQTQSTTLSFTCTNGTPVTVSLGGGSSGDANNRAMTDTGGKGYTLPYTISTTSGGTSFTQGTYNGQGPSTATSLTLYMTVDMATAQSAQPGYYNDSLTITLSY